MAARPRLPPPAGDPDPLRPVRGLLRGDRGRARTDRGVLPVPAIRTPHQTPKGCCDPALAVQERLTTVRSTLIGPDGRPLAGREVMAVLRAAPPWLGDGTGRVVETARTRTDRNGEWMLPLLPKRNLEPHTNESGTPVHARVYESRDGGLVT